MGFIGGDLRESFIGKVKGADPGQLLAVPIDVGKNSATAMVCDFWGEIISPPFAFDLNERGFQDFAVAVARAEAERDASWVRVGLEQAGHYHRPLQARLEAHGLEVILFNPAQVKANRNQDLLRSLKSDALDLAAMAELLIRGKGRLSATGDEKIGSRPRLQRIGGARSRPAPRSRTRSTPTWTSCSPDCRIVSTRSSTPRWAVCCSTRVSLPRASGAWDPSGYGGSASRAAWSSADKKLTGSSTPPGSLSP
jgi:hypothetical protein